MHFFRSLTFSLLFTTVFLGGCQKENAFDCFKSTGAIKTETRPLPPFRTLRVFDNLEVTIVADHETYAEVAAGDNLLENIETKVENGELSVRNINKCNWVRNYDKPLKVRLHVAKLKDIFHDGDGLLRSENTLPCDTLFLHITGAGDTDFLLNTESVWLDMYELGEVRLSGNNRFLTAYVLSQGSLKAKDLKSQEAFVKTTWLGHAYLTVDQTLQAEIIGPGNVYYYGTPPNIQTSGNGTGKVIKAD